MSSTIRFGTPRRGNQLILFIAGALFGAVVLTGLQRLVSTDEEADITQYRAVRDFVAENFVREVPTEQLLDGALSGMLRSLDDYSRYYSPEEARELDRDTSGRYTGIGVILKRPIEEGRILFTLPGSPAERAGLQVGDLIVGVDGVPLPGPFDPELLRRDLDSEQLEALEIDVIGLDGSEHTVAIEPASLINPTVRHAHIANTELAVGYLSITSFSHETPLEFDNAFRVLKERGMKALVIDLRANLGGVLSASVDIARRFVAEGIIVSTEGSGPPDVREAISEMAISSGFPLVVLVDGNSASASEVMAAALQDHRVAVLIGTPTYGKGLVQTIHRFPEVGSIAKVTTSYYYTPSHRNLDHSIDPGRDYGILPDIEITLERETQRSIYRYIAEYSPPFAAVPAIRAWEAELGETLLTEHPDDPQLQAALDLFAGKKEQE